MKSVVYDPFLVQPELGSLSFMRCSTAFQSYHWKLSEGTHRGTENFGLKIFLYFQRQRERFDSGFGRLNLVHLLITDDGIRISGQCIGQLLGVFCIFPARSVSFYVVFGDFSERFDNCFAVFLRWITQKLTELNWVRATFHKYASLRCRVSSIGQVQYRRLCLVPCLASSH